ncbi:transcription factor SOX9 (SOX group E) [Sarotherodon galilaeus]
MLKLIMVLLWMILLVVLLCAEAKNVTEVRGELGTNVTLTCSKQTSDTHWYMEIHSQFRADVTIIDPQSDCRLNQLIIICVSVAVIVFVILGE